MVVVRSTECTAGRYGVALASFETLIGCRWELVVFVGLAIVLGNLGAVLHLAGLWQAGLFVPQRCKKGGVVCLWPH